ncbi:hypothetical protein BDZ85DRAFT_280146 [Elsinoe ampelina]|uniref:Extracellular membrane protein CFEM domain-containing protein n=1 Tax=Elsinoe ampelina TaxID=302913 RepID=A0A6A6GHJ0_9PEZI|nr:hypothetical protein BDZ85DRAFT_280146 [Elsinoe ampelina]
MKFTLMLAGLVGLAVAQSASGTETTASTTSSVSLTPAQTCLAGCGAGDVNCQAACLGNPYPNEAQINATTECSMNCVQGNGTQEETEAYGRCLEQCRASYFISTGTNFVGANPTGAASSSGSSGPASGSASATGAVSSASGSAASAASGASSTASGAASSSSGAASSDLTMQLSTPFAGLVAFIIAAVAL